MSLPDKKDGFTYFEVTRPVQENPALQRFLRHARHIGATVLAPDIAAVHTEDAPDDIDDFRNMHDAADSDEAAAIISGIRSSRLRVYEAEDLRYALLHYRIPPGIRYAGTFNRAAQRVNWDLKKPEEQPREGTSLGEKPVKSNKRPKGELYKQLLRIGLQYDVMSPDTHIALSFDHVTLRNDPDLPYVELGLVPSPEQPLTLMLLKQAKNCFDRFHAYSVEAATLVGGIDHSIPFARLPADLAPDEQRPLLKSLAKFMPVRIELGGIESRHNIAQR